MNYDAITLHGQNSTLILKTGPAPEIVYWGERVNAQLHVNDISPITRAVPHAGSILMCLLH